MGVLSYVNGTVKNRGNQSKEKSKYRHNKILTLENTSEFVEVGFRIFFLLHQKSSSVSFTSSQTGNLV